MKKTQKIIVTICGIAVLCIVVFAVLKVTVLQKHQVWSIKNSDGYIYWLQIYDDKLYYVQSPWGSDDEILYCYDDENGLRQIDSDDRDKIISDLKNEYYKVKIKTNNAGMECTYEDYTTGYVLTNQMTIYSNAEYRYVDERLDSEPFPYENYELEKHYYGLVDEYIVGKMHTVESDPEGYDKAFIALIDKTGNISVIPDYVIYDSDSSFLLCNNNCIYFWGAGENDDILETGGLSLYTYIVDTGEVRKLCDYKNLCRSSDLYTIYASVWSSGGEEEVFIDQQYLYSYSINGDTDIIRFKLTYDENGYPVKCEYDTCIYANPYIN